MYEIYISGFYFLKKMNYLALIRQQFEFVRLLKCSLKTKQHSIMMNKHSHVPVHAYTHNYKCSGKKCYCSQEDPKWHYAYQLTSKQELLCDEWHAWTIVWSCFKFKKCLSFRQHSKPAFLMIRSWDC